ncbi:Heme exporter protein D (CcmD) [Haloplanus vescus]|uniref:Heme exporter protein D (CcmD) n=1 Tax=Haloplanus vescus TaxID=555874 RepID=A0A1H3WGA0_9EURY|nr:heme exporter protein CcmD [Haloplanus vescus]SDZ85980.1 Heme exporter protein D (CcmD) [Haloplanus vescus]
MTLSALGFAVLIWGAVALVALVFVYELLAVWRDRKEADR